LRSWLLNEPEQSPGNPRFVYGKGGLQFSLLPIDIYSSDLSHMTLFQTFIIERRKSKLSTTFLELVFNSPLPHNVLPETCSL